MTSSVFPEDFPGFDVLGQIEDMTPEKLAEMPDQDVLKIKGIGPKTLEEIRAYDK
jgi:DNA-directed RNA polymerase alpha subunit